MSGMSCKWDGRERPRVLPGRHGEECSAETCAGCLPCAEAHCRVCGRTHAEQTCPECIAAARSDLHDIARMCDALPEEVEHRGIDGEAMMLLGPVPNPEARGHLEASVLAGRVSADYLEAGRGELHPRTVLWTWEDVWREHLDAPTTLDVTMERLVDFLDRQLHHMAGEGLVPFEDFARDLRRCSAHLASVLHDQNQGDRANIGCFECGSDLERRLTGAGFEDHWTCRGCRRRYTYAEYNFALRASLETIAESA